MGPRNYFPHAIGTFYDKSNLYYSRGQHQAAAEYKAMYVGLGLASVCWHLSPEVLKLAWLTDLQPELFEKMRLPYSVMALEYDYDYDLLKLDGPIEGACECKKRCTIMADGGDGIWIYSFFIHEQMPNRWIDSPIRWKVLYKDLEETAKMLAGAHYKNVTVKLITTGVINSHPIEKLAASLNVTEEQFMKRMEAENNPIDDIRVCLCLLQLLSCHNAPDTVVVEPPEKLNKKRIKHGKVPIPRYRTLHIPQVSAGGGGDGTHSPKSTHYRRGHIRQQWYARKQEHRAIWVAPMVINAHLGEPDKPKDVEVRE